MSVLRGARSWLARTLLPLGFVVATVPACREHGDAPAPGPAPSASAAPGGLSPELAARVLARVGDRTITLGEYAAALERMDRFERMRYQTVDRRKQLLDEMIDVELLAREAERRGLASRPETQELVRQILRDELLRDLRSHAPTVEDIPAAEVRAYYDGHKKDFHEPERRRISAIVVKDGKSADRALAEAKDSDARRWGEVFARYAAKEKGAEPPAELAGDLGLVTAPASGRNDNPRVPDPVRAAAFEIEKSGAVLPRVVADRDAFYVVRLTGKNDPRDRSLEEADRTIRVRLLQEKLRVAEEKLEEELRKRFPVKIDEIALSKVEVPKLEPKPEPKP